MQGISKENAESLLKDFESLGYMILPGVYEGRYKDNYYNDNLEFYEI